MLKSLVLVSGGSKINFTGDNQQFAEKEQKKNKIIVQTTRKNLICHMTDSCFLNGYNISKAHANLLRFVIVSL